MVAPRVSMQPVQVEVPERLVRVALAHDWLCGYRGGEGVLERLAMLVTTTCEDAGLYTMFDDGRPLAPAIDGLEHHVSWLSNLPDGARRWALPLYRAACAQLSSKLRSAHAEHPIDLLFSTSSSAIKGMRAPKGVPHVCYCHAPARYMWTNMGDYAKGSSLRAFGLRTWGPAFRRWDRANCAHVTRFLANSTYIASRIRECWGRESEVVHPPVRTAHFTPDPTVTREDFWLVVSAMEPYKNIDDAIKAANRARHPLVVVGDGSERARLERLAGGTVEFRGRVDERTLIDLYRRAACLLYPQVEDFGITAVEAQACGTPVVALARGGALDTVQHNLTGALYDRPTPGGIIDAFENLRYRSDACRERATRFSEDVFDRKIRAIIDETTGLNPR